MENKIENPEKKKYKYKTPRYVFDMDNTVIDSEHRRRYLPNGHLDLKFWIENNTEEKIMQDTLLPLAKVFKDAYNNGHEVVISTSRVIHDTDLEYFKKHGLNYHQLLHRGIGDRRSCADLKRGHFRHLMSQNNVPTVFYEDKDSVIEMAKEMENVKVIDSKIYHKNISSQKPN